MLAGTREARLPIVGTLPGARAGQVIGVMDLGHAQWRLDRLGKLTRIDVKLAAGTTVDSLSRALQLPPGVAIASADAETTRVSNLSRAYRVNLNVLALVALFTGGFLVFSLQAQATIARRSQLAFLRVAGVTSRELQSLLVVEASILGVAGSALGLLLGAAIASLTLNVLGGDLGSGFFTGTRPEVQYTAGRRRALLPARPRRRDRRQLGAGARRRAHLAGAGDEGRRRRGRASSRSAGSGPGWPCSRSVPCSWRCRRSTAFPSGATWRSWPC